MLAKTAQSLKKELRNYASTERKTVSLRFFKTGKGEYGEGGHFIDS